MKDRGLPVDEFVAPWPLLAVVMMTVNDHVLKGAGWLPGWLTGKVSDFAGLFFFPLFFSAVVGVVVWRPTTPARLAVTGGLTALAFTLLQLSTAFSDLYVTVHRAIVPGADFVVTQDPTDLFALVMVPLAYAYGIGRARPDRSPNERSNRPDSG